jgi:hypothetical protein
VIVALSNLTLVRLSQVVVEAAALTSMRAMVAIMAILPGWNFLMQISGWRSI